MRVWVESPFFNIEEDLIDASSGKGKRLRGESKRVTMDFGTKQRERSLVSGSEGESTFPEKRAKMP